MNPGRITSCSQRQIKQSLTLLLLSLLLTSCSSFSPFGGNRDPLSQLRSDIDQVLRDSIFIPSQVSIKISSIQSGELLFERNSKLLIRPASNMKLLTSATALAILGTSYSFSTVISSDSILSDGTVLGNVYLKGFGNPDLLSADIEQFAAQIKDNGIKRIMGGVVADVSFFDDLFWGQGWQWDDEPYDYAAFISPLTVNDNCIRVIITPGSNAGEPTIITTDPNTEYITLQNQTRTVSDTARKRIQIQRLFAEHSNTIVVTGEIVVGAKPVREITTVWKPELYTAQLFHEALIRNGMSIQRTPSIGIAPVGKTLVQHNRSIDSLVINLNKISDNLSAEMTLKTLGAVRRGTPGTARNGIYVVNEFLNTLGIDTTAYTIADGSGLSYYTLLTTEMILKLLQGMAKNKELFPLYYKSLPIAGVDGTLRTRMKGSAAEKNLRAKTGSISGVSSLSGYVISKDGELIAFSMSMQNFIYPMSLYRKAQDQIGVLLANFSRERVSLSTR
ncbi:MAG: D-alanyl-D-alanine carboxypeptidase/D-alanyl-D-alanine-endopeptidase [bacterium]